MVWIPRWNNPKRKEDNENAVRRALLAGGFAAGASGLLTRKALADTPYTSFAYPLSSLPSMRQATATRTSLQRFADVFNVKDFGALGNGMRDDANAIQAAINAAIDNDGGTVYFPAGRYIVGRRLEIKPRNIGNPSLTLLGNGGVFDGQGSRIEGNFHDYVIWISSSGKLVKSIQGLSIKNTAEFAFDSAEAPGNPDGFALPPGVVPNGGGCIYFGMGSSTGSTILNCSLQVHSGICLHNAGYMLTVMGTLFTGSGFNGNTDATIGYSGGSVELHACKMFLLGTCVAIFANAGIEATSLNMEVSGVAFRLGANPVGFWDANPKTYHPAWSAGGSTGIHIRNCVMESIAYRFIEIDNAGDVVIENLTFASYGQVGVPLNGIFLGYCHNARIANCGVGGTFSDAAISMQGGGLLGNIVFENVRADAFDGGGVNWRFPPASAYGAGDNPVAYINCNTDGAIPLAQLPVSPNVPAYMSRHPVMITDSTVPLWTGTASNVGKPAVGGGTNKVLVRWNPRLAKWVLAG
jgi:Pectate lyase superfamily protein